MAVWVVAEAGVNHLGVRTKMLALCDAAKAAGSDAVKFQAYNADALVKRRGAGDLALLKQCELSDADLDAVAAHCKSIGIKWFASVFDPSQIERVLSRGACHLKVGHAEWNYTELIDACAKAVDDRCTSYLAVKDTQTLCCWVSIPPGVPWGKRGDFGMHPMGLQWQMRPVWCINEYPATSPPKLWSLGAACGFSSHYVDHRIPAAAALRGAEYIEAHLKLSDTDPEAAWSLSVEDFGKMVKLIREYEGWL